MSPQSPPPSNPTTSIRQKIHSLRSSPSRNGLICLCNDGVLRSFSSTGTVVDYARLSPEEIQDASSLFGTEPRLQRQMRRMFRGVDGYDVPSEKLEFPDRELIPGWLRGKGKKKLK